MKVIIIDDESLVRKTLETILRDSFPNINIVGQAGSVVEAVSLIKEQSPDLILLDVDLTDGNGFDVLTQVKPINFKVIFITAHQEYAIKAIKFSAFDFILKPISQNELTYAVQRVIQEYNLVDQNLKWNAFFNNLNETHKKSKKIVLKTSESIHIVQIDEIIRCEADNNYSTFFLLTGEKIVVSKGLKEFEELLTDYGFFRVHQSHLINLDFVLRFDKKDGGYIILSDNSVVPVSQRKKQKLLDFFDAL